MRAPASVEAVAAVKVVAVVIPWRRYEGYAEAAWRRSEGRAEAACRRWIPIMRCITNEPPIEKVL